MVDGVGGGRGGIRSPGNSCLLGPGSYQKEGPGEQKRRLSPRVLSVPAKGRHGTGCSGAVALLSDGWVRGMSL